MPWKRWDFGVARIGLGLARGLPKPHLRVLRIGLVGLGEYHVGCALRVLQELVFPIAHFLFGLEPALGLSSLVRPAGPDNDIGRNICLVWDSC